jgi:hypothetical protein
LAFYKSSRKRSEKKGKVISDIEIAKEWRKLNNIPEPTTTTTTTTTPPIITTINLEKKIKETIEVITTMTTTTTTLQLATIISMM